MNLKGKAALIVGGVGPIGRALARGMLQAGADVIVNSRSESKLAALAKDLGNPSTLHCVQGTMMPSGVDRTIEKVLGVGTPNHVVAHSGVAWWGEMGEEDETSIISAAKGGSILDMERSVFAQNTGLLVDMHFGVAQLLMPKLQNEPGSSYTFLTGTTSLMQRHLSPLNRINVFHVSGLASALRAENKARAQSIYMSEVRVGNLPMRDLPSVAKDPNQLPLSAEIGMLCAGIAQAGDRWEGPQAGGHLHVLDSLQTLKGLRERFPVTEAAGMDIPALWYWEGASSNAAKPTMATGED